MRATRLAIVAIAAKKNVKHFIRLPPSNMLRYLHMN
jgi:hypothetical protein